MMYALIKCKRDSHYNSETELLAVSQDMTKLRSLASDDLAKHIATCNEKGKAEFGDEWEDEVFDRKLLWLNEVESEEVNTSVDVNGWCTFYYVIEEVTQL